MKWILNWIADRVCAEWHVKRARSFEYMFDYDIPLEDVPQHLEVERKVMGETRLIQQTVIPELNIKTASYIRLNFVVPGYENEILDVSAGGYGTS